MAELEIIYKILQHGGSTAGTIVVLFLAYKFYEKRNNNKPAEEPKEEADKVDRTEMELRITQQENKCRDRFYDKIQETEEKIIEAIKKNGK